MACSKRCHDQIWLVNWCGLVLVEQLNFPMNFLKNLKAKLITYIHDMPLVTPSNILIAFPSIAGLIINMIINRDEDDYLF